MSVRVGIIIGTRPEAIKLAPLIPALRRQNMTPVVVLTGQHRELLTPILSFFDIIPDLHLDGMVPGQSLGDLTARLLHLLDQELTPLDLTAIVVQGDTTSALAGAMIGFYHKIPVIHVEAGLRTDDIASPFPEEFNRRTIDQISHLKFPPTDVALAQLKADRLDHNAYVVGNTVIDALFLGLNLIQVRGDDEYVAWTRAIGCSPARKKMLVTTHRRENAGQPLRSICMALKQLLADHSDLEIILPVHRNPEFYTMIHDTLGTVDRMILLEPLPYDQLIWLMNQSTLILTDSGGLQEEGPALNKPVLVMRETTERPEGVDAGCARLVGTATPTIVDAVTQLLHSKTAYEAMANRPNPYGDGTASDQIVSIIQSKFR
jgi:UDP-N-acetylglucosamine 2-epimerase (non-hydrolysing)